MSAESRRILWNCLAAENAEMAVAEIGRMVKLLGRTLIFVSLTFAGLGGEGGPRKTHVQLDGILQSNAEECKHKVEYCCGKSFGVSKKEKS
jgi:hypothetical protein